MNWTAFKKQRPKFDDFGRVFSTLSHNGAAAPFAQAISFHICEYLGYPQRMGSRVSIHSEGCHERPA
jgi:hypothetical protein